MKPRERKARILEILGRDGEVSVEALAADFAVSAESVRRDLSGLASTGALYRVRGGARRLRHGLEGSFQERMADQAAAKAAIANRLALQIEAGETLFMDTGTTTLACAGALAGIERLTVITNSLHIAQRLGEAEPAIRVVLLGGTYGPGNSETVGPIAIEQIGRFRADTAVLTVAAIDAEDGALDADFDEAQVARAMIARARRAVVVADSAKFGRRAAFGVCRLEEIDMLVCEQRPQGRMADALAAAGVVLG